jgi:hypothetical protein
MSESEEKLVQAYSQLLEGLSAKSKISLIESLVKSLKEDRNKDKAFYDSYGAFASDKSPEDIMKEIKEARKFRNKDIQF